MTGTGDGGHDTANDRMLEVIPVPTTRTVGTLPRDSLTKPMKISLGEGGRAVGGWSIVFHYNLLTGTYV